MLAARLRQWLRFAPADYSVPWKLKGTDSYAARARIILPACDCGSGFWINRYADGG
jgi:hypothetical protein